MSTIFPLWITDGFDGIVKGMGRTIVLLANMLKQRSSFSFFHYHIKGFEIANHERSKDSNCLTVRLLNNQNDENDVV